MKKAELKAIADRYEMGIIREEITGEGIGLYLVTEKDIPELDTLASTAQSFGDNRRSRLALDSGFSRRARLVAGRPNGAPLGDV